jgi:hypothetical protein
MINLRNIPFYFVGLVSILLGLAFADQTSLIWYIVGGVFILMGVIFRKQTDTSDAGGH